ncbi:MAG: hypothetical protein ACTH0S_01305 [Senegalia sp. (in: firmicutes)]
MEKNKRSLIFTLAGALLAVIGIFLGQYSQGIVLVLLNICIGLGAVLFGRGMSNIMIEKTIKNKPNIKEQIEIDENDERNIMIANRAKAKTYDMLIFVFPGLTAFLGLMEVDLRVIFIFVFAFIFSLIYGIYFRFKYDKEM